MSTIRRLCRAPLLLLAITAASAQQPNITPDTPVDQPTLHKWLHSGDPRLIAWAADFARRNHDTTTLAEMPDLLEHWAVPQTIAAYEPQAGQHNAILSILDALIEDNVQVPTPAIQAIVASFPAQAAILIARLPLSQSRSTLETWTYGRTGFWNGEPLARIASMLLAKDPGPTTVFTDFGRVGFVASVVDTSEEDLEIRVQETHPPVSSAGFSRSCGAGRRDEPPPAWPDVYMYGLYETSDRKLTHSTVVELSGDQISSNRGKVNEGVGRCVTIDVHPLDPETRHRLIAYWLGVSEHDMTWQPTEPFTIVWTTKTAYETELGKILESQRHKLSDTVESLRQKGLLKADESAMPRLVVTIHCDMTPCPLH